MNSHVFQQTLESSFDEVPDRANWIVAFSGGVDSTVLLHAASRYLEQQRSSNNSGSLPRLSAIHIDHQLSPNHLHWKEHCQRVCEQWGVHFHTVPVDVDRRSASLEQAAREARYSAFASILDSYANDAVLLMAHHADDQAETVLLRQLRGTGVQGAAGMAAMRGFSRSNADAKLARPLLSCDKSTILAYANHHELQWIEDESNYSTEFDRNYLRIKVMPALSSRWPALARTFARFARLAGESQQLNRDLAEIDRCEVTSTSTRYGNALSVESLMRLPSYRRRNLYRLWVAERVAQSPSDKVLGLLDDWVCNTEASGQFEVGDCSVRKYRDDLYALCSDRQSERGGVGEIDISFEWPLQDTKPVLFPVGQMMLTTATEGRGLKAGHYQIKQRNPKSHMQLNGMNKSVHKLMQEIGVPTWLRNDYPVIYQGEKIAAIPPLVCDEFVDESGESIDCRVLPIDKGESAP